MVECFADSLMTGFLQSSMMGKGIVLVQLTASVVMFTFIIGKWRELTDQIRASRRVTRDVMGGRDVLDHYLQRKENGHSVLENIYWSCCDRLLRLFAPDVRSLLMGRQPGVAAALTAHEMGLVKAICDHVLDEESIRVERGMGVIEGVVALAPMLGLLGTVWGVLDAFADMGAAGSATIATMAPAISSALVTTVVGLLIAIPGVALHGALSGMVRKLLADMEGFADDLMGRIALEFQDQERGA
ncbi:MAG: MotA/TolQ/ExbB proton channel family protein [Kiritimatiellia bacterium]